MDGICHARHGGARQRIDLDADTLEAFDRLVAGAGHAGGVLL
jgi:hypothetical protein